MTDSNVNLSSTRTFTYTDSFFQVDDGTDNNTLKFIQDWNFTPSMDDFDIDRIDSGDPIFTRKSDILGGFAFNTKNTVDIYSTSNTSTDLLLATNWINNIADGTPTAISFISILKSPKQDTNPFVTLEWTGRIMSCNVVQVRDTGVQEFEVEGEITAITTVQRSSSV